MEDRLLPKQQIPPLHVAEMVQWKGKSQYNWFQQRHHLDQQLMRIARGGGEWLFVRTELRDAHCGWKPNTSKRAPDWKELPLGELLWFPLSQNLQSATLISQPDFLAAGYTYWLFSREASKGTGLLTPGSIASH